MAHSDPLRTSPRTNVELNPDAPSIGLLSGIDVAETALGYGVLFRVTEPLFYLSQQFGCED